LLALLGSDDEIKEILNLLDSEWLLNLAPVYQLPIISALVLASTLRYKVVAQDINDKLRRLPLSSDLILGVLTSCKIEISETDDGSSKKSRLDQYVDDSFLFGRR
jgi:hypothetical protein